MHFGVPALQWLLEQAIFPGAATGDIYLHPVARAAWVGHVRDGDESAADRATGWRPHSVLLFSGASPHGEQGALPADAPLGIFWKAWFFWAVILLVAWPPPSDDLRCERTRRRHGASWDGSRSLVFILCFTLSAICRWRTLMKITATIITLNEERKIVARHREPALLRRDPDSG